MPSVQIKDVPEETHRVLTRRAAAAHQSLQEYLRARLIAETSRPTLAESLAEAAEEADASMTADEIVAAVNAGRDRR